MSGNNKHLDTLAALIAAEIASAPVELDGCQWCALSQSAIVSKLGFSVETLRRLIQKPPIVRKRAKGVTLLRVGEPGPVTGQDIAKAMGRYFNAAIRNNKVKWQDEREALQAKLDTLDTGAKIIATKRIVRLGKLVARPDRHTRREFGCMVGLTEVWPDGHQMDLFKMVLTRWPTFMAGVKYEAVMVESEFNRHLEFASVIVMRKYPQVALHMAEMEAQEGGTLPPWMKAMKTFKPK